MAGSSLLMLIDDIASVLDDVAILTKVAAKKTSGVLGDDLALNAEQVAGVRAEREIPVILAVAKGSAVNKAILVPLAILISYFLPWLITPLLLLGGLFLCFEGFEKIWHYIQIRLSKEAKSQEDHAHLEHLKHLALSESDLLKFEQDKIKGAIRTDFILSAEIITITLGTVANSSFSIQLSVLLGVSLIMTLGVYGLVSIIVKLDDLGYFLLLSRNQIKFSIGKILLKFAPYLMKSLSFIGTAAMFLVGGGIISHGFTELHHLIAEIGKSTGNFEFFWNLTAEGLIGALAGMITMIAVNRVKKLMVKRA